MTFSARHRDLMHRSRVRTAARYVAAGNHALRAEHLAVAREIRRWMRPWRRRLNSQQGT